jgi:hypothetical protein
MNTKHLDAALEDMRDSRLMHTGDASDVDAAQSDLESLRAENAALREAFMGLLQECDEAFSKAQVDSALVKAFGHDSASMFRERLRKSITGEPRKHPACIDRCQILEHKGYHTCSQTGRCEWWEAEPTLAEKGAT